MMTVNAWIQGIVQLHDKDHIMPNYTKMDICHYWDNDDLIAWPMPIIEDQGQTEQQNEQKQQQELNYNKDDYI